MDEYIYISQCDFKQYTKNLNVSLSQKNDKKRIISMAETFSQKRNKTKKKCLVMEF